MEADELTLALAWYQAVIEDGETLAPVSEHQMKRLLADILGDIMGTKRSPATVESLHSALTASSNGLIPRPSHIPIDHPDVGIRYTIEEAIP